jgi:hypothetical protein
MMLQFKSELLKVPRQDILGIRDFEHVKAYFQGTPSTEKSKYSFHSITLLLDSIYCIYL